MKIVQIAAATAALSVVEAHPSNAKCHAERPYAVGGKIMGSVTIGANPNPLNPQVTAPMMGVHGTLDPVKLTFKSATTAGLYWLAQADKGSLAAPTGADCKAVAGCTDTVYCSPGAAATTDLTWTPPADSAPGKSSKVCVFWGTTGSEVTGECATMTYTGAGSVTMPDMSGAVCAMYVTIPEQKTACEAAVEKCKTAANMVTCVALEMAKAGVTMAPGQTLPGGMTMPDMSGVTMASGQTLPGDMTMPDIPKCGAEPEGKQYRAGFSATSPGNAETCFENKQTVEEGSSGATATIAVAGMMAAIAAF